MAAFSPPYYPPPNATDAEMVYYRATIAHGNHNNYRLIDRAVSVAMEELTALWRKTVASYMKEPDHAA